MVMAKIKLTVIQDYFTKVSLSKHCVTGCSLTSASYFVVQCGGFGVFLGELRKKVSWYTGENISHVVPSHHICCIPFALPLNGQFKLLHLLQTLSVSIF